MQNRSAPAGISAFGLHLLAMAFMLCDHLWATLLPAQEWLTCVGRMAFPIFAFMIVEGYFHTSNFKRYARRLLLFALLSEVPFNLLYGSSLFYPFHQNVLWTLLLGLLSIRLIEKVRARGKVWLTAAAALLITAADLLLGMVAMVDYFGAGIVTVLVFYFFRETKWWCRLGQLVCLYVLNVQMLGGYYYAIPIGGYELQVVQQGLALLALLPIWLYDGRQGYHSRGFQYFCYGFYPLHMLLLYFLWQFAM